MNLLTRILTAVQNAITGDPHFDGLLVDDEPRYRSLALSRLVDQLWDALQAQDMAADTWTHIHDLYTDGGNLFAIVSREGALYRVNLFVDGDTLTLGEWMRVQETFTPVTASRSLTVKRQADGRYRWVAVAGTAILNRSGELDSTELFRNFVRRAEETGQYPGLDFYHLQDHLRLGQADYVAADGVTYIASGLFDDTPYAAAAIRSLQTEPGYWGTSIEFLPIRRTLAEVAPDVSIPVYEDGENLWISMLPEKEAAHLMTSLVTNSTEERTMNERTKAALLRLLEDDEDLVAAIESRVDGVGRAVAEQQLVSREAAETEEATAEATEEAPIEEAVEEAPAEGDALLAQEVELDDEAITMLAQAAVQSPAFQALLDPLRVSIATLTESLAALAPRLEAAETRARTAEECSPRPWG